MFRLLIQCFVEARLATVNSLESSWVCFCKLCTPGFGQFILFFLSDPLKLCQTGWEVSVKRHLQVSSVSNTVTVTVYQQFIFISFHHELACKHSQSRMYISSAAIITVVFIVVWASCSWPQFDPLCFPGYSSLHLAACWGHLETVRTLLEVGADTQAQTFRGERPVDLARRYSKTDCADCLILAGVLGWCTLATAGLAMMSVMLNPCGMCVFISVQRLKRTWCHM